MPLTAKGQEILASLEKQYGPKKAEQVLYAGKNSGKFSGIDSAVRAIADSVEALCGRMDTVLFNVNPKTGVTETQKQIASMEMFGTKGPPKKGQK